VNASHTLRIVASYAAFELRRTLRDPQVLIFVGFPAVFYPTLIWGVFELGQLETNRHESEVYTVSVDAPDLAGPLGEHERLVLQQGDDEAVARGTLDAWVAGTPPALQVHAHANRPRSQRAAELVEQQLRTEQRERLQGALADAGMAQAEPWEVRTELGGEPQELLSWILGLLVAAVAPLAMLLAGVYPVIDLFVVERERDTLETLLVSRVPRSALVAGKLLACTALIGLASLVNVGALSLSALHVTALMVDASDLPPPPSPLALGLLLGTLATAALLFATAMMAAVVPARTYKEAEWLSTTALFGTFPLVGLGIALTMTGEPAAWAWAVPIAHTALAIASTPTGQLTVGHAATAMGTDLVLWAVLMGVLSRTPGFEGLLAGGWRPAWVERWMGGEP
jgi:ABC-type Na+ efflux pump permease subunit